MNQPSNLNIKNFVYGWMLTFFSCWMFVGCVAGGGVSLVEEQKAEDQRLIFSSNRDGNWEIYMMNADGSNPVNLTHHPANDRGPTWSPMGKCTDCHKNNDYTTYTDKGLDTFVQRRVAFVSDRDGNEEIYVMNIDGSEPKRLTYNPGSDTSPLWSPDGKRLLFISEQGHQQDIYMINDDGSNQVDLTQTGQANETDPAWMPDGERVVFVSDRDGNKEIYLMNTDGSNVLRLTNNLIEDGYPQPSLDGGKIAFLSDRNGNRNLFTMDTDGSHQINLPGIVSKNVCTSFIWALDGMKIVFATGGTHTTNVYQMLKDGSGKNILLSTPASGCPSGLICSLHPAKLAYTLMQNGNWEIYVGRITRQTPNFIRLTNNQSDDIEPEWEPTGIFDRQGNRLSPIMFHER
jgi:Tol biopolymer transport system component